MVRQLFGLVLCICMMALWNGCYYDVEEELYGGITPCDTTNVSYTQAVATLLDAQCTGCHSGADPDGSLMLDQYVPASEAALSGLMLARILLPEGDPDKMPPEGSLSSCHILTLEQWVINGAPEN